MARDEQRVGDDTLSDWFWDVADPDPFDKAASLPPPPTPVPPAAPLEEAPGQERGAFPVLPVGAPPPAGWSRRAKSELALGAFLLALGGALILSDPGAPSTRVHQAPTTVTTSVPTVAPGPPGPAPSTETTVPAPVGATTVPVPTTTTTPPAVPHRTVKVPPRSTTTDTTRFVTTPTTRPITTTRPVASTTPPRT